ncbi:MAG: toll/interleukin-1 receptor domain-containing protein [Ktedonobacteraceae bacterium]|nr:toll/interleukin-1 receptor domain-containing protein [Ktedonobacteraceae bacterium]
MTEHEPLKVFYSYSHKDEKYKEDLESHLSVLTRRERIKTWCDLKISPGTNWRTQITNKIDTSDIILLLISADFLASDYCYSEEMERALQRHASRKAKVIPIYVRPVYRSDLPFENLLSLPADAKPVTSWADHDLAWVSVIGGISNTIDKINEERKLGASIHHFNKNGTKQNFSNFPNVSVSATSLDQKLATQEDENSKIAHQLKITELIIDARIKRLKSIVSRPDISREEADAAIDETQKWLEEHENDTNIRQFYLSVVEKKGTPKQVKYAITFTKNWLSKNSTNTNVRAQYIILVTEKTDIVKANQVIQETENWINQNKKKDESVLIAYLGLIEKWGTIEQFQQAINNVENWCSISSQTKRLKEKLSKLRKEVETDKHRQSTMREPARFSEIPSSNIDRLAQEFSRLAKEGSLTDCEAAIEATRRWLRKHREDTNIRQVYLKLVGKEGIDKLQVQKALEETERWLLEKGHDSNTSVRQAYLRLVKDRGTLTQQKKALQDIEGWLKRYDNSHIRESYHSLLQAIEKRQGTTSLLEDKINFSQRRHI